jgi:hypothetical protein
MTGAQKTVGWVLFAILVVVLIAASTPTRGIRDGHQGSYLGRKVEQPAGQPQGLGARTMTQRY